jgi:hypothetical protein
VGELFNDNAGEVKIIVASREEETAVYKIVVDEVNAEPDYVSGKQMELFA